MFRRLVIVVVLSTALHLIFGWMWSVLGAIAGGWMTGRRGWLVGGAGLVISWASLIIVSIIQAPPQVSEMARVIATLVGGLPPFTTYIITLIMACILGILGGFMGTAIASFRTTKK